MIPWYWSVRVDLWVGATTLVWAGLLFWIVGQTLMAYGPPGWFMTMLHGLTPMYASGAITIGTNAGHGTPSKYLVSQNNISCDHMLVCVAVYLAWTCSSCTEFEHMQLQALHALLKGLYAAVSWLWSCNRHLSALLCLCHCMQASSVLFKLVIYIREIIVVWTVKGDDPSCSSPIKCEHHWLRTHCKHRGVQQFYHSNLFCLWHQPSSVQVVPQWYHHSRHNIYYLQSHFCSVQCCGAVHLWSVQLGREESRNIHTACAK